MTQSEIEEEIKKLLIENRSIRKIIDDTHILHYRNIDISSAQKRYEELLEENIKLKTILNDIYDL